MLSEGLEANEKEGIPRSIEMEGEIFLHGQLGSSFLEERLESRFVRARDIEKVMIRSTASLS